MKKFHLKILVVGCWRTGSTAAYNLIRMIFADQGRTIFSCFEDQYLDEIGREYDVEIVKAHKYRHKWVEWADAIITTYREPEEVRASMQRFAATGGRVFTEQDIARGFAYWGKYQYHAHYQINFEQFKRSTIKLTIKLADFFSIVIDENQATKIVRKFRKIKPPREGQDPVTLLHHNHITQR